MSDRAIDEGRIASDAGLRVSSGGEGAMNAGKSYSGDIGFDENDFLALSESKGELTRNEANISRQMHGIAHHTVNTGARQMVNDAYMNPNEASMMMEQEAYQPPQQMDGWSVVKQSAQLQSGKRIAVFVVEDSLTGMTTGKKYRLAEVAEKVARVVNATNNPSDSRIGMIDQAYDTHVKLMREKAAARKDGNGKRVAMIESKLQEVNTRLGIA